MNQAKAIVLATVLWAFFFGAVYASPYDAKNAEWDDIKIRCDAPGGTVKFIDSADLFQVRIGFGAVTHSLSIQSESIRLDPGVLSAEGRKVEIRSCREISVVATPDSLMVEVTERSSSSSSSHSSQSASTDSTSTSNESLAHSSSESSSLKRFGFAAWNGKELELVLSGGDSIESTIDPAVEECKITFDIDRRKNRRTISLGHDFLEIDGKKRHQGGDYSRLLIAATGRSLEIKTDGKVIGSWAGNMGRAVLEE